MRKGFRAPRRFVALSFLVSVGLVAVTASADEEPIAAQTDERAFREKLRQLTLAGRGADVRVAVSEHLGSDRSEAESSALLELLAIADAWSGAGSPQPIDIAVAALPDDWGAALDIARGDVAHGAYAVAIVHLETLRASAPNLASAARAIELRAIAAAALRKYRPPTAVMQAPVAATESSDDDAPEQKPHKNWYGWQTLVTDGSSLLITPVVPVGGLGVYLLGGPIVHLAHGHPGIAAASLGIRAGLPVAGALTGAVLGKQDCSNCEFSGLVYAVIGAGLGAASAIAIDAAAFGREDVPAEPRDRSAREKKTAFLGPSASPRREGGFDVGVMGTW